jgi:HPt (histidine-containing phosphotransfer) domain-containing protein
MTDNQHILDQIRTHLHQAYNLDADRIKALLPGFLSALSGYVDEMEAALANNNQDELVRSAHRIKGALVNLGLQDLAGRALILEQCARSPDTSAKDPEMTSQAAELAREIRRLLACQAAS